jgi:hypothetical protein
MKAACDQLLASADERRDDRRVAVLIDEAAVRARVLDRVQVGADDVLGHGERQRLAVGLAHVSGHLT